MLENQIISVKIKRDNKNILLPKKQTDGAGCYDVYAFLDEELSIASNERKMIPTGLRVEIPKNYILSIRPRSGLAIKKGLTLINSPGTIDSDYRGEIKILVINHGSDEIIIKNHERIAQFILEKTHEIQWLESEHLEKSNRDEGGFGSTGRN